MSTVAASSSDPEPVRQGRSHGSLLGTEALRFRSRRMVRVLLLIGLVGFLAGAVVASTQFATPSAAGLADAAAHRQQIVLDQNRSRADCLASVGTFNGPPTSDECPPAVSPNDAGTVDDFLAKRPFTMAVQGAGGVLAVSAATAAVAFLIGATFVGAEWSSRSIVALLFWEPRRYRVMAAKLTVVAVASVVVGVLAETAWLTAATVLAATRGTSGTPQGLWAEMIGSAGRGVLFVLLVALLGFGIANLIRNTAAALGVGFLYFALVESVVRAVRPAWQQWLYTDNAIALLSPGGLRINLDESYTDSRGQYHQSGRELLVSNLHAGLLLTTVTAAAVVAGMVLFARRDLS